MDDEPIREDLRNDVHDGATLWEWCCEPPAEGLEYEVTREEHGGWRRGFPVRRILEVRITGGYVSGELAD